MTEMNTVKIKYPEGVFEELEMQAKAAGMTTSELSRALLEKALQELIDSKDAASDCQLKDA